MRDPLLNQVPQPPRGCNHDTGPALQQPAANIIHLHPNFYASRTDLKLAINKLVLVLS